MRLLNFKPLGYSTRIFAAFKIIVREIITLIYSDNKKQIANNYINKKKVIFYENLFQQKMLRKNEVLGKMTNR